MDLQPGLLRLLALVLAFSLGASSVSWAQDDDEEEDDDGDSVIEIGEDDPDTGGEYGGIEIEPFPPQVAPEKKEPNRPDPVVVGEWIPPALNQGDQKRLEQLLGRRAENPKSPGPRYALAEFYLSKGWLPHAEAEFLACASLDAESIRPWVGALRVYRAKLPRDVAELDNVVLPPGIPARQRRQILVQLQGAGNRPDWIPSDRERSERVGRALKEVVKRRPDDVSRRRELLDHYRARGEYGAAGVEARAILKSVPGDAQTRYELTQSLLYAASDMEPKAREPVLAEVRKLLEENVRRAPDHAPSLLRLARVLAVQEGVAAQERIVELQKRAFLRLFLNEDLGPVPYREDTFRMARDLAGKSLANTLWDEVMEPEGYSRRNDAEVRSVTRWLEPFKFPHSQARDREAVLKTLGRRGDAAAAVVLLSFLWSATDPDDYPAQFSADGVVHRRAEDLALGAVAGLGSAAFPAAKRFLAGAKTNTQRRRGVAALRGIGDKRAAGVLLDALEWDVNPQRGYFVARALEELGDEHAIDALVAAALDVRRPVPRRREAAEALAAFNDPRSVEAINRLAKEDGFETVTAYAKFRLSGDVKALQRLVDRTKADGGSAEMLRIARKCKDPRIKTVLLMILRKSRDPILRDQTLATIKERFWKDSRESVELIFLTEAKSEAISPFVIKELGEMGGDAATTRLLELLKSKHLGAQSWAAACRALARTGDERAVRWFNRRRVLEKDPGKRKLASLMHEEAAKRAAERKREG